MSGQFDEQTLIQSARRGDTEAFNFLIDRYQDLLFRIALRMLGDEDNAADATQQAWVAAFRKISEFRGDRLQTWLARVVVNTCYDEIRRRYRRREVPFQATNADGQEFDAADWLVDPGPGVEEQVMSREMEGTIHDCLQSLPPVYRTMLVLVDIEGFSYEEAAMAARVPVGTVRSRLARARMAVRQRLEQTSGLPPTRQRFQVPAPAPARVSYP